MPLSIVSLNDPPLATLYERPLVLVRPDGHVAWRGTEPPADASNLIDRVRGTLGDKALGDAVPHNRAGEQEHVLHEVDEVHIAPRITESARPEVGASDRRRRPLSTGQSPSHADS